MATTAAKMTFRASGLGRLGFEGPRLEGGSEGISAHGVERTSQLAAARYFKGCKRKGTGRQRGNLEAWDGFFRR